MNGLLFAIESRVRAYRDAVVELCRELISIPTINPPGLNYREFVDVVESVLRDLGLEVHRYTAPRPCEEGDERINIVAFKRLERRGRAIHIHTHYDVVPPGRGWVRDPFKAVVEDGRLYGRGASDMKCAIAASLYAIRVLDELVDELGLELCGEVSVSVTPDEETGGLAGAGYLVGEGVVRGVDYVIVPEPTSLVYVWHAHKGCLWYRVRVRGRQAHATLPHLGVNAFEKMVELAAKFMEYRKVVEKRVSRFEAYPAEGRRATIALGGMCGCSDAVNVVPGEAWFTIDRRVLPEESVSGVESEIMEIIEEFRRQNPDTVVELENLLRIEPSHIDPEHELVKLIQLSVREALGLEAKPALCPGFLNTRYFIEAGMPAVAWGPGDLEQAHAPNEYIELDKLFKWMKALITFLIHAMRPHHGADQLKSKSLT